MLSCSHLLISTEHKKHSWVDVCENYIPDGDGLYLFGISLSDHSKCFKAQVSNHPCIHTLVTKQPCKVPPAHHITYTMEEPPGAIWGSISCPGILRHVDCRGLESNHENCLPSTYARKVSSIRVYFQQLNIMITSKISHRKSHNQHCLQLGSVNSFTDISVLIAVYGENAFWDAGEFFAAIQRVP